MRTAQSDCLLCKINKATKTKSHIIPKFLTKSLFGLGNVKRGFTLSSKKADKPPLISQDSPKEDYILCPDCESYFSVLETYVSNNTFRGLWDTPTRKEFEDRTTPGGIKTKLCVETRSVIFHLFIYSIVWRCAISSVALFQHLKLKDNELEGIRDTLYKFSAQTLPGLSAIIDANNPPNLFNSRYVLITSEGFSDATANVIFIPPGNENPYYLILNQFQLFLSFEKNSKHKMFAEINNVVPSDYPIEIAFFPITSWSKMLTMFVNRYASVTKSALDKAGKRPYLIDENKL